MRDPARIDGMLEVIRHAWMRYPDLRLGQLLVNAVRPSEPCPEVFYVEDSSLLQKLADMERGWDELAKARGKRLAVERVVVRQGDGVDFL